MHKIKESKELSYIFITIIDIIKLYNIFLTEDKIFQNILSNSL
jgi:hypothetical protein